MRLEKIKAKGVTHLFRDSVSGMIYFRAYKKGHGEIFKSTKTGNLNEAKVVAEGFRAQLLLQPSKRVSHRLYASEHWTTWVQRKRIQGKSNGTLTSIEASGKYLLPFLRELFLEDITALWWETVYIPEASHKGICQKTGDVITRAKPRKLFNDRKWLFSFLKSMKADGALRELPTLINPDPKGSPGKVFSDDEMESLINFAQGNLRLAILMAATMGMRRGEIFHLRWTRVNLTSGFIALRAEDTKTRKARTFAISPSVLPELVKRAQRGSDWVFPSELDLSKPVHKDGFNTAWATVKRLAGVEGRFHDLRHTFLTKAFKIQGSNPALICHYAGLSLETAVRVYLHFTEEDSKKVASLVTFST